MDRLFGKIIVVASILLVYSCGQIGFITGGEVDEQAPKPILEEVNPPMASVNVRPQEISIPFDEFIQLNSPLKNISVVPADVTLEASVKGKSLILKPIKGEWAENTTYAIYLNRAVKDVNEGNDSLMTYVFATGPYIDSLETAVRVVDAYTNKPVKDITVGLYDQALVDDTSNIAPRYMVMTDGSGVAQFRYLQKGPFFAYAFRDKNQNTFLNESESRGQLMTTIYADTLSEILPEIRLMTPKPKDFRVESNEFIAPATWCLGFSKPLPNDATIRFGSTEPAGIVWNDRRDSLTVFYSMNSRSGKVELIVDQTDGQDTITKKYFFKNPEKFNYSTNLNNGKLHITDTLSFRINEAITTLPTEKMAIYGKLKGDSIFQSLPVDINYNRPDELRIMHDRKYDSIHVTIPAESVGGANFVNPQEIHLRYQVQSEYKVGTLIVTLDSIPSFGILEITTDKGITVKTITLKAGVNKYVVKYLQPQNYLFNITIDSDENGVWSVGDIFTQQEAEKVIWFDSKTQVRANWDVEVKLSLKDIEPPIIGIED